MESISKRVRLIISVTFHDVCPVRRRMDLHICNFSLPHLSLPITSFNLESIKFRVERMIFPISLLKLINVSYDQFRGDFKRDF